ncbi:MAG TPA: TIGR02281 family clan AA aspartic protease [Phenylobacterium sp.]|uniref:retropepsin-like aspartic protease family protein n=1 Tax=Phenylobacterium sp. TaxID=1871053 RepID=UPI002BEED651|nr:TIGR02281 family clan AA aspartic protease [Phenylobacterium sp.]HSV04687.1 TIGR02281 family clan AA aspartic protease [Phenylobacterium sp.]
MVNETGPWANRAPRPPPAPRRTGLWVLFGLGLGALVLGLARAFPEAVRTRGAWADAAYSAGLVVLVSAGLFRASRSRFADRLKHAAAWLAIAAVLALGFAYRDELKGIPQHLRLAFSAGDPVRTGDHELVIPQDDQGVFVVVGKVNGQRVRFVVDTGATDTVLNLDDARRLGIDPARLQFVEAAETANGKGYGARVRARRLEIGPIVLDGFEMVVNQAPMRSSLLGLSFLKQLDSFEIRGRTLVLKWHEPAG